MKIVKPNVTLLSFSGVKDAMIAASNCVSSDDILTLENKAKELHQECNLKLLKSVIIDNGHLSIAEFIKFNFGIEGIHLANSHQWVRHRLVSNAQKSQRYITHKELVVSLADTYDEENRSKVARVFHENWKLYNELLESGMKAEDARLVLPQAVSTTIVCTMNARELIHIINERTCTCAQNQIRFVANEMLRQAKVVLPEIFCHVGPKCYELGRCPEKRNGNGCQLFKRNPHYKE